MLPHFADISPSTCLSDEFGKRRHAPKNVALSKTELCKQDGAFNIEGRGTDHITQWQ